MVPTTASDASEPPRVLRKLRRFDRGAHIHLDSFMPMPFRQGAVDLMNGSIVVPVLPYVKRRLASKLIGSAVRTVNASVLIHRGPYSGLHC